MSKGSDKKKFKSIREENSTGLEITLEKATEISEEWIDKLSPFCIKINEAGTVRRKDRETTNDIDIVLIRDLEKQKEFSDILDALEHIKGKSDGKWCMRKLESGVVLDIQMCEEDDWGWNLFRHTGPTSFHLFAIDELEGQDKDFKTEDEVFDALGIDFIEPSDRAILETKETNTMIKWIANMTAKKQIGYVEVIKNEKHPKEATISIRGFIGSGLFVEGVTDKSIANALNEVGKIDTLKVIINSGGGSVFHAFSIFTQFRMFKAKIITIIEGLAASGAAFISQSGDEREMSGNALFMIHESTGDVSGNKKIVGKLLNGLIKIDKILESTFVKTSIIKLTDIRKLMDDETFLTAQEAIDKGFIDTVTADSDVEPHIHPKDNQEEILEEIYKRHAEEFEKDSSSFDDLTTLVDNELSSEKFSTEPFRLSGDFDYDKLSISNLPCVENGIVNINGLRYLNARLPLTPLESDKKREEIQTWIKLAKAEFEAEKGSGKYRDDVLPSRIVLEVDVAGKAQTFIQKTEDIQMNALILNALDVKDESLVLAAIKKLKESNLTTNVVNNVVPPVATLEQTVGPVPLSTPLEAPAVISEPDNNRIVKIETQLAQILTQNATLIAENTRKDNLLNTSISRVEEVMQFKNQSLLNERKKVIDELFYDKKKLSTTQYKKAQQDFVEIEPKDVPETESLYNLSIQLFKTNDINEKMQYLRGQGGDPEVVDEPGTKYEKALDAIIKENGWNPDNEGDLTRAMAILEDKNPELASAVVEDSKVKE